MKIWLASITMLLSEKLGHPLFTQLNSSNMSTWNLWEKNVMEPWARYITSPKSCPFESTLRVGAWAPPAQLQRSPCPEGPSGHTRIRELFDLRIRSGTWTYGDTQPGIGSGIQLVYIQHPLGIQLVAHAWEAGPWQVGVSVLWLIINPCVIDHQLLCVGGAVQVGWGWVGCTYSLCKLCLVHNFGWGGVSACSTYSQD